MRIVQLAALAAVLAASVAGATPPPCSGAEHHQFDFWVGDWTVVRADNGKYAGQNRIESVLGGCALHENWVGAAGGKGNSYNAYDATRGVWHQTWVDSSGELLVLEGKLTDGKMVLAGEQKGADGKPLINRITWSPLPDGTVRQRWDVSTDGGKSWSASFDGIYSRRGAGGGVSGGPFELRTLRGDI